MFTGIFLPSQKNAPIMVYTASSGKIL